MPKGVYRRPPDFSDKVIEGKRPGYVKKKSEAWQLYEEGVTPKNIAKQLGVKVSLVKRWVIPLPKHTKGVSGRPRGYAAQRVARLTGRDAEVIRQEMVAKESNSCYFCESNDFEAGRGWFASVFHHHSNGTVDRAHAACNAISKHSGLVTSMRAAEPEEIPSGTDTT